MIRAIAVDDEKLSLMRIERILREIPGVRFLEAYQNPSEAAAHDAVLEADVAFLDVEMPELDGLALSELLVEKNPNLEVIFVTAHEKYALQAYQLNAIGYLLKPVQFDDVRRHIERVSRYKRIVRERQAAAPHFKVFGQFYLFIQPNEVAAFRTEKTEELLALLLSQRGKPVSRDYICALLWPDMTEERAVRNFHTTAYNIRNRFCETGITDILLRNLDSYRINSDRVTSDLDVFCAALHLPNDTKERVQTLERALQVYDGVFMEGRDYVWLVEHQAYYERLFEDLSISLCVEYEKAGHLTKAADVLRRMLHYNETSERACARLMSLYRADGQPREAYQVYQNFRNHYLTEFGEEPPASLKKLL